jgi:TPR repeat protein
MKAPESQTALAVAQSTALVRKAAARLAKRGLDDLWMLESAEWWFKKAKCAKSQNRLSEFFEYLQRTVILAPEHTEGLDLLGVAYHDGIGTNRDQNIAVEYFRRAAERGYALAQYHLALVYDRVESSKAEGLEWERKAAEQGYAPAVWRLAHRYVWGNGVPRSRFQAEAWYRKAAEKDHAPSQFELAKMYQNDAIQEQGKIYIDDPSKMYQGTRNFSVGVIKKLAEAESWCRKAANQGLEEAKEWLAKYYPS